jgi:hypothetical protein
MLENLVLRTLNFFTFYGGRTFYRIHETSL